MNALTFTGAAWAAVVIEDAWSGPANRTLIANDVEVTALGTYGAYGIAVAGDAHLTNVHLHDYFGTGIHVGGDLTIEQSVIEDLEVDDVGAEFNAVFVEGSATLDEVLIRRNGPTGASLPLATFPVDYYPADWGATDYLIKIIGQAQIYDSLFEDNVAYRNVLHASTLSMSHSSVHHNWSISGIVDSENLDLRHVAATNNGGVLAGAITGGGAIADSTISGNVISFDDGSNYAMAPGVGGYGPLLLTRSTVTNNHGPSVGGISADGDLTIHESTIAGNTSLGRVGPYAPFAPNAASGIAFFADGRTFELRNSVITSTTSACNLAGTTVVSLGHNFDSDGTCGLSDPTDVSAGGDPMLGALADNGGATETILPLPGSPLLDAVPAAAAGCAGETSQNALVVPQGLGCEIGAAEVPSTARLAGHVTAAYDGHPLAGVEVRVRSTANTNVAMTTTGADGTWTIAGLASGDYKVLFRDPTGAHNQTFNGSAWPFAAAPAVTVTGDHTTLADQALTADNTLTGTVTDTQTGLPVAGAQVRVRTAANTYIRTATTNAAGVYTIADLTPGDYKLLFRDPTGAHEQTFNGSTWPFSAAPAITVTTGTVTVDQAMVPVPAIGGTVTEDDTSTPLAGIEIRVRTLTNTYLGSTTTAPDGTWKIHLPAGTYKLLYTDPTAAHTAEWHDNKPGFTTATPITHTTTGETLTATLTPVP